jgi:hypothetical protein
VSLVFECLILLARGVSVLGGASNRLPGDWRWVRGAGLFLVQVEKLCANRVLRLKTKDILTVYIFDLIKNFPKYLSSHAVDGGRMPITRMENLRAEMIKPSKKNLGTKN